MSQQSEGLAVEMAELIRNVMASDGSRGNEEQHSLVDFILENQQDLVSALVKAENVTVGIPPQI